MIFKYSKKYFYLHPLNGEHKIKSTIKKSIGVKASRQAKCKLIENTSKDINIKGIDIDKKRDTNEKSTRLSTIWQTSNEQSEKLSTVRRMLKKKQE